MKSFDYSFVEASHHRCEDENGIKEIIVATGCVNSKQSEIMLKVILPTDVDEVCNTERLENAIIAATDSHTGVKRKCSDTPYIAHPMEAALIVSGITNDIDVLTATVLHDVVEDTSMTISEIEESFGKRVATLVAAESEDKMDGVPPSETWERRKGATIKALKSATLEEKIITLADKLSNIRSISRDLAVLGEAMWERFNQKCRKKHEWYYRGIAAAISELSDSLAYKEFCTLIDTVFA